MLALLILMFVYYPFGIFFISIKDFLLSIGQLSWLISSFGNI